MVEVSKVLEGSSIAFVGNYLPRKCGIATFTHDLCEAVAMAASDSHDVFTVAMNDVPEGYPYPERVRFEIRQNVQADYRLAAEFLNINQVSAVCLQHEYGIYGGTCGSHLLSLLRRVRRPLVSTLHTVLRDPNDQQKLIMKEIIRLSGRLVVMADVARGFLEDIYDCPSEKIAVIPHGIPDVPFVDPHYFKEQFGVEGRTVLLTFGLLSPGKGIEYVIDALPDVIQNHPEVVYILLGATHPHVKAQSGEEYRNSLMRRVHELGIRENVIFIDRFVVHKELCEYLGAADIYVTPYLQEAQITSGTLAYAAGAGKPVISTPYWHANELLADGRGVLVPFRDSDAIANSVLHLLENSTEMHAIRRKTYNHCRSMIWKRVAQDYMDLFHEATTTWIEEKHTVKAMPKPRRKEQFDLPDVDLRHLRAISDDVGIFQHCKFTIPDRDHGYCVDDNTRALMAVAMHWDLNHDESVLPLMKTYLSFMAHAWNDDTRRFRNFMGYNRQWLEPAGSNDSHARSLWGLGMAVALCPHESMIALATRLFMHGLPVVEEFDSCRSWAFTLCGIQAYLRRFGGDSEVRRHRAMLSEKLLEKFQANMTDDWPWCENELTYANAKLPHALIMCGKWMNRGDMIDVGIKALHWLLHIQTAPEGHLSLIGSEGWYSKGGTRAKFDQQCIDAHALVDACIEAYHVTRDSHWIGQAQKAFYWFLGENDLRTPLYDFTTGGCRDGLEPDSVNENQGAESTLAWIMSLLMMQDLQMELSLAEIPTEKPAGQRPVRKAIEPTGPVVATRTKDNA